MINIDNSDIIYDIIDDRVNGVDTYHYNGSMWLIFTDDKKWVIELTKDGTLWYNYYFFNSCFKYLSLDVVENQHYITKWVEKIIENGVKETKHTHTHPNYIEDTIENGVKETKYLHGYSKLQVEDTIQNGVKHTEDGDWLDGDERFNDIIQNGVKHAEDSLQERMFFVEDTIENGIKETQKEYHNKLKYVEKIIQNGVKEVKTNNNFRNYFSQEKRLEKTLEHGVKKTELHKGVRPSAIENTIQNGVKLTNSSLQIDGSCVVEDVIQNGIKDTKQEPSQRTWMTDNVVKDGVKLTESRTGDQDPNINRIIKKTVTGSDKNLIAENVIKHGVKETKLMQHDRTTYHAHFNQEHGTHIPLDMVQDVVQNGIKETKTPGVDGDLLSTIEWMESNNTKSVPEMIDDVIVNGVKETKPHFKRIYNPMNFEPIIKEEKRLDDVNDVLEKGIKETRAMDEWVNTENIINKVIDNGVKEVQPLPAQDGNKDWGIYYHRQEDRTKPHTNYVDDVINLGIKRNI
jgi:hypothetical protein